MANLIQIKRSENTATPTSLANGELAWSGNSNVLFIGNNSAVVAIAGGRNPGTLTANQALVANSTSGINKIITANAVITTLTANGVASPGAGYLLSVDGGGNTYWLEQGAVSINTSAQYSWSNTHSFTNGTTSTSTTTGAVVITGGLGVGGKINAGDFAVGNSTVYSTANGTTITTANVFATATVNALSLSVGNWVVANQSGVFTSGIVNGDILAVGTAFRANTTQVTVGSGIALSANGGIGAAGQVLHSNGSSVYWANTVADITSVTAGDGLTGGGTTGDLTLNIGAANGINVTADAVGVTTGSTLTVNSTGIHVNSALSITDLSLSGNLTVTGTLTTIDTTNLVVQDPLIKLANGNVATDALDIGFFGVYDTSGTQDLYAGMFRDATDNVFKLFVNSQVEPTTTVDTAAAGYTQGTLQSFLNSGGLVSNTTAVTLTANSTLAVNMTANTLTLSTSLAGTSGGTGLNSYTSQDILVANTTNGFNKLSLGTSGKILQSDGSSLVYADLDGGTF